MRGLFEFEIDGVKRGMLCDFMALGIVEENMNIPLDDIISKLGPKNKGPKVKLILEIFYASAVNYCDFKDEKQDFTRHHVSGWIAEIGFEKCAELLMAALSTQVPKNSKPLPEMEGIG